MRGQSLLLDCQSLGVDLIRAPSSSLTPRSHNLSGSLPKVTVLSVTPMYDTVAIHYVPSSSGWVRDIVIPHKKYTGNTGPAHTASMVR